MVQIARAEDGFVDEFHDIIARTYNSGDPLEESRKEPKSFRSQYVALKEDRVVGAYILYEHDVHVRGGTIRCGGVAAVAVPPEARDGGIGVAMMKAAVARMREDGFPIATLYAFREPFYAKAGYASVGRRFKIEVPAHRIPKGGDLSTRKLTPGDWKELEPCYESFAAQRNGMALRTPDQWQRVLAENRPLTIYAAGNPVQAYVVVSHKTDFWSQDHISEIVWSTSSGYSAILGVLRGLATNKKSLTWFEPSDGPFLYRHLDEGVEANIMHPIMGRMVDVKACLEKCRPEGEGSFAFSARDPDAPENEGPWRVTYWGGTTRVERSETADFEGTVGALTQALYGEPSLADLVRIGTITGTPSTDAKAFFSPASGYCLDFF